MEMNTLLAQMLETFTQHVAERAAAMIEDKIKTAAQAAVTAALDDHDLSSAVESEVEDCLNNKSLKEFIDLDTLRDEVRSIVKRLEFTIEVY